MVLGRRKPHSISQAIEGVIWQRLGAIWLLVLGFFGRCVIPSSELVLCVVEFSGCVQPGVVPDGFPWLFPLHLVVRLPQSRLLYHCIPPSKCASNLNDNG